MLSWCCGSEMLGYGSLDGVKVRGCEVVFVVVVILFDGVSDYWCLVKVCFGM